VFESGKLLTESFDGLYGHPLPKAEVKLSAQRAGLSQIFRSCSGLLLLSL